MIGWPGHTGHGSAAAWSHTVNTKSKRGPPAKSPAFGAQSTGVVAKLPEQGERYWMHRSFGMIAGAKTFEPSPAPSIDDTFSHDASRQIAGAEEQHIK